MHAYKAVLSCNIYRAQFSALLSYSYSSGSVFLILVCKTLVLRYINSKSNIPIIFLIFWEYNVEPG
jgi:hypothetical protein